MEYLAFFIGYAIIFLTPVIGRWDKLFARLDQPGWAAFIPFYNYFVALRVCKQPWYWVVFLLMPGIQFIMWASVNVTMIRRFGEFGVKETVFGILFPFPVFWNIAKDDEKYAPVAPTNWDIEKQVNMRSPSDHVALFFALPIVGHLIYFPFSLISRDRKKGKKSVLKEWGDAILFALIAASAIRTYVFEPYTIPTGSMEKTLMVGDYLFVEKLTYGPRVPMTPFSFPVVHNTLPWINTKSYVEIQDIPYTRVPGIRFVERNDVTVFNFPAGDTALGDFRMPYGLVGHTYEQILRDEAFYIASQMEAKSFEYFEANLESYKNKARQHFEEGTVYSRILDYTDVERGYTAINGVLERPVDKRENYIKRCVAIAGDLIEIKDKELYINGELAHKPEHMQYKYYLDSTTFFTDSDYEYFEKSFGVDRDEIAARYYYPGEVLTFPLNETNFIKAKAVFGDALKKDTREKGVYETLFRQGRVSQYLSIFPNDPQYDWTEDNFGPLRIPAKGDVVELNHKTLPIYRRIITAYEGHVLKESADGIFIDGKQVTNYTIEMDYYWMMGDNRNGSADSRFWGFVPEDHIVGKAAFIWLSAGSEGLFNGGARWDRVFTGID